LCLESHLEGDLGSWDMRKLPFDSVVFLTHTGTLSLNAIRWLQRQRIPLFFLEWNGAASRDPDFALDVCNKVMKTSRA
jgi:hypothetical protein